jgi:hypothetical protein
MMKRRNTENQNQKTKNPLTKDSTIMKKLLLLATVALATLAVPQKTIAAAPPWTTACSAGATLQRIDLDHYSVFDNYLTLAPGELGPIVARYNVTNTTTVRRPAWTTFELGYLDTDPSGSVTATLVQFDPCENVLTPICTVTSVDNLTCQNCTNLPPFDFANFVYYVEVTVSRSTDTQTVRAESLRLK